MSAPSGNGFKGTREAGEVPSARRQNAAVISPSAMQSSRSGIAASHFARLPRAPSQESRRKAQAERGYRDPSSRPTSTEIAQNKIKRNASNGQPAAIPPNSELRHRLPKNHQSERDQWKSGRAPANTRAGSCRETPTFPQFVERRLFCKLKPTRDEWKVKRHARPLPKPRSKSNREVAAGQTRDTPRRQAPAIGESEQVRGNTAP